MEKLKQIKIKNCKNHKNTVIDLHPNVNIIKGESDNGKSAIFCGVDIVVNNNPTGFDNYRPWDSKRGDKTKISLVFEDGSVTRTRSKGENKYVIDAKGFDKNPLTAFGQSPPDLVNDFINFKEYNFRNQEDKYFFINKHTSSAERAKMLNGITGLSIIDKTQSAHETKIKEIDNELKFSESSLSKYKEELSGYGFVEDANKLVLEIDELQSCIDSLEKQNNKATQLIDSINSIENRAKIVSKWLLCESDVVVLKEQINSIQSIFDRVNKASKIMHSILETQDSIDDINFILSLEEIVISLRTDLDLFVNQSLILNNMIKLFKKINEVDEIYKETKEWLNVESLFIRLKKDVDLFLKLSYNAKRINWYINQIEFCENKFEGCVNKIKKKEQNKKSFLQQCGICPTCGGEIV